MLVFLFLFLQKLIFSLKKQFRREAIHSYITKEILGSKAEQLKASGHALLVDLLHKWEGVQSDRLKSASVAEKIRDYLENISDGKRKQDGLEQIYQERNMLAKKSHWIIGGDGWAYDIGFAGLDHVLASGDKVNILVLDNEVYANTGGQASKGTVLSCFCCLVCFCFCFLLFMFLLFQ